MDAIVQKALDEMNQLKESVKSSVSLVDSCIEGLRSGKMSVVECSDTIERISNACRTTLHNVERLLPEEEDV